MDDYIKREDVIAKLNKTLEDAKRCGDSDTVFAYTVQGVLHTVIDDVPAVDVRENVRGKWIRHDDDMFGDYWECSNCHDEFCLIEGDMYYNFCPNCGADMRGEKNA